jgi:F-box domain
MDHFRSRKRRTQKVTAAPDKGQDLISNLPEDLKGKILSYLPARDAVKTSILSSRWQYSWVSAKEISIREADFTLPSAKERKTQSRFSKFVDALLYLHNEPIISFYLETGDFYTENYFQDAIDRWILHLSWRKELRKFSFNFSYGYHPYSPTSLFSCHGLSSLKLGGCCIKLPKGFQGFKLMHVLELQGCPISDDDLEKIVSSCPILEELVITKWNSWFFDPPNNFSLKICAPKLKKLIIHGRFTSLLLKTPCLVQACFELEVVPAGINGCTNLVEALGSLPAVEILGLRRYFLPVNESVNFEV